MENLWPIEIGKSENVRAPFTILKEQAANLGQKTGNLVEAEVRQGVIGGFLTRDPNNVKFYFDIIAQPLGNYRYELFSIAYNIITLYPVEFFLDAELSAEITVVDQAKDDFTEFSYSANSEAEFLQILKQIFSASKTKRVIQSILAHFAAPTIRF